MIATASRFRLHHEELIMLLMLALAAGTAGGLIAVWWRADRRLTDLEREVDRLIGRKRAEKKDET